MPYVVSGLNAQELNAELTQFEYDRESSSEKCESVCNTQIQMHSHTQKEKKNFLDNNEINCT